MATAQRHARHTRLVAIAIVLQQLFVAALALSTPPPLAKRPPPSRAANSSTAPIVETHIDFMQGETIKPNPKPTIPKKAVEISPTVTLFYLQDFITIGAEEATNVCIEQVRARLLLLRRLLCGGCCGCGCCCCCCGGGGGGDPAGLWPACGAARNALQACRSMLTPPPPRAPPAAAG
jgi:hypothetical protein